MQKKKIKSWEKETRIWYKNASFFQAENGKKWDKINFWQGDNLSSS